MSFLAEKNRMRNSIKQCQKQKVVRSFSLDIDNCECLPILLSVYSQMIDHCRAVGKNFRQTADKLNFGPEMLRYLKELFYFVYSDNTSTYIHTTTLKSKAPPF